MNVFDGETNNLLLADLSMLGKDDNLLNAFSLGMYLGAHKKSYKRQVYSFLDMIGDIGGLADGLFILFSFIIHFYN